MASPEPAREPASRAADAPAPTVPALPGDTREFRDADHVRWTVAERDARADPGARGERCLIFATPDAIRRVWDYPPDWRALSDAALLALSWRR